MSYQDIDISEYNTLDGQTFRYSVNTDNRPIRISTDNPRLTIGFIRALLSDHEWTREQQVLLTKSIDSVKTGVLNTELKLYDNIPNSVPAITISSKYLVPMFHYTIEIMLSDSQ